MPRRLGLPASTEVLGLASCTVNVTNEEMATDAVLFKLLADLVTVGLGVCKEWQGRKPACNAFMHLHVLPLTSTCCSSSMWESKINPLSLCLA